MPNRPSAPLVLREGDCVELLTRTRSPTMRAGLVLVGADRAGRCALGGLDGPCDRRGLTGPHGGPDQGIIKQHLTPLTRGLAAAPRPDPERRLATGPRAARSPDAPRTAGISPGRSRPGTPPRQGAHTSDDPATTAPGVAPEPPGARRTADTSTITRCRRPIARHALVLAELSPMGCESSPSVPSPRPSAKPLMPSTVRCLSLRMSARRRWTMRCCSSGSARSHWSARRALILR